MNDPDISGDEPEKVNAEPAQAVPAEDLAKPVMAELAAANAGYGGNLNPYNNPVVHAAPTLDLDNELRNLSATGGAVAAFVLGIWSIISAMITFFAFIIAMLAIALGMYGLASSRKRLATIGIVLGLIGLLMSFMEISEWIGSTTEPEIEIGPF